MTWKEYLQDHILTYVSISCIAIVGLLSQKYPAIASIYPTFVGGVLALCGIHKGSEVAYDTFANKGSTQAEADINKQ